MLLTSSSPFPGNLFRKILSLKCTDELYEYIASILVLTTCAVVGYCAFYSFNTAGEGVK